MGRDGSRPHHSVGQDSLVRIDHRGGGRRYTLSRNTYGQGLRLMNLKILRDVAGRIVALFLVSALGIITGAALVAPDLEIYKSAILAGFSAVAGVVQKLAQAALDGTVTSAEVDDAFGIKRAPK